MDFNVLKYVDIVGMRGSVFMLMVFVWMDVMLVIREVCVK